MTTVFDSFDGSRLGEFIESPLQARNPNQIRLRLIFLLQDEATPVYCPGLTTYVRDRREYNLELERVLQSDKFLRIETIFWRVPDSGVEIFCIMPVGQAMPDQIVERSISGVRPVGGTGFLRVNARINSLLSEHEVSEIEAITLIYDTSGSMQGAGALSLWDRVRLEWVNRTKRNGIELVSMRLVERWIPFFRQALEAN